MTAYGGKFQRVGLLQRQVRDRAGQAVSDAGLGLGQRDLAGALQRLGFQRGGQLGGVGGFEHHCTANSPSRFNSAAIKASRSAPAGISLASSLISCSVAMSLQACTLEMKPATSKPSAGGG